MQSENKPQMLYLTDNMFLHVPAINSSLFLKWPLTPKFFLSRQKSPFCSDHNGEKLIVVQFFLDIL